MVLLVIIGISLLLNSLPNTEVVSWGFALLVSLGLLLLRSRELSLPRAMAQLLIFPGLLLCIMLHGVYTHPATDFLKDCWYFSLPLVYLAYGYLAFERIARWQPMLQPMILVGAGLGAVSLLHAALNRGELAAAATVDAYRAVTGGGTFVPMLPVVMLLIARRTELPAEGLERWKPVRLLVYLLGTGAVLVTFSRTHILTLAAGLLCTLSPRRALQQLFANGGVRLVLLLLLFGGGVYFATGGIGGGSGPLALFVNKVMNSGSEVQVRAYETFGDINNNWRGFEAYRAARTYSEYSLGDKVFGGGGGSLVDLGIAMQLSPTQAFKFIPLTHNGYMYVLIKTGVVGIALFVLFVGQLLYNAWRALRLRDTQASVAGLALLWTPIVIVATQGVITGIYNKGELMPVLFLTGAAVASYAQRRRVLEARATATWAEPSAPALRWRTASA